MILYLFGASTVQDLGHISKFISFSLNIREGSFEIPNALFSFKICLKPVTIIETTLLVFVKPSASLKFNLLRRRKSPSYHLSPGLLFSLI